MVRKALRVLAIAGGALLLTVTVAGAQVAGDTPDFGLALEGPLNTSLLEPVLHTRSNVEENHIPTPPPPDSVPRGFRAGPVSGSIDGVLKTGKVGAAIVGPRAIGSIYNAKQQADREIRRLIRELD